MTMTTNYSTADRDTLQKSLEAIFPYVCVTRSTLGGEIHASLIITVSMDPKNEWINGILHNSRYSMFSVDAGKIERFSGYGTPKLRKSNVKTMSDVTQKLTDWAEA